MYRQLPGGNNNKEPRPSTAGAKKARQRPMTGKAFTGGVVGVGQRDRSRSKSKRRHDAMYSKTDLFERQQLKDERKRMETKKELKSLLTKFIGPDRTKYVV